MVIQLRRKIFRAEKHYMVKNRQIKDLFFEKK